ncbi:hypothetical protein MJ923_06200 [Shewanella sp. 3B26]|uniref:UDP-glycosyltransferase n=1 Tax=Shewanella zhuhaiensis TaxID=2919576 RepID=A0AAJ1BFX1_9GAMM|nr:hypothetical protein [Shewanella zhuhaiensis]MCH4293895.1 hypothetical protein [Shewanella zhuhaiensis]
MVKKNKVFLIAYGGGHIKMLLPIIRRLRSEANIELVVFGLTTALAVLDSEGVDYISYSDFSTDDHIALGKQLLAGAQLSSAIPEYESFAYHGVNFSELKNNHGTAAWDIWMDKGRQSFYPIEFFKSVLKDLSPDLVLATNSPRSEKAALDAAAFLGISSICMVDMFALQEAAWICKPNYATKICVLNDSVKDFFVKNGCDFSRVVVTGNPAFDAVYDERYFDKGRELRSVHGLSSSDVLILYASQPEPVMHPFCNRVGEPDLPRNIEHYLRDYVRDKQGVYLAVRYHPSENVQFISSENVIYSKKIDELYSIVHASDVVVVTASTVGLEASLVGKQVISVDCSIFTEDAPFSKMGISKGASSIEALGQLLDEQINFFSRPEEHNFIHGCKDATGAVCAEIYKILNLRK